MTIKQVKNKDSISLNINAGFSRARYNTGVPIKPSKEEKEYLEYLESKAKRYFYEHPMCDADDIVTHLSGKRMGKLTLYKYFELVIPTLNPKNGAMYSTTLNSLKKFHKKDIPFEKVDYGFIRDYQNSLKLSTNGSGAYMRTFRALWNRADKEFQFPNYPFKNIVIDSEIKKPKVLPLNEIREVYKSEGYERDTFMLLFFLCGINLVDVYFNDWQIKKGRFEVNRKKSGIPVSIKIEPEIKELLPKKIYNNRHGYQSFIRRLNVDLKKLGKELKLSEPLTTYVARYSWANLVHHELGYEESIVDDMLGHVRKGVMRHYLTPGGEGKKDKINREVIDLISSGK